MTADKNRSLFTYLLRSTHLSELRFLLSSHDLHILTSAVTSMSRSLATSRVKITFLRVQNLPIGAAADVFFDNGTGEIDYNKALNDSPIRIWPAWQDKAGFGMAGFGMSDFGYDGAAAVGFAKGNFGFGSFGFDADTIEWISPVLPQGVYKFAIKIGDPSGRKSISKSNPVTVTPAAKPAENLSITSFNNETNQLALKITR